MANLVIEEMRGEDWLTVPDNPRQRDTEAHWNRAKTRHLAADAETHRHVSMARSPSGSEWKLDGHTRSYAWANSHLKIPSTVIVSVYEVADVEEAKTLYGHFDNSDAAETLNDKVAGAYHEWGFRPQSGYLKSRGGVRSGINFADLIAAGMAPDWKGFRSLYGQMGAWLTELKLVDTANPRFGQISSKGLASALLTIRKYPKLSPIFWDKVFANEGTKQGTLRDGVQGAWEIITQEAPTRSKHEFGQIAALIWCFEKWRAGENFVRVAPHMDIKEYLKKPITKSSPKATSNVTAISTARSEQRVSA